MDLRTIINEVDIRIPNTYTNTQKVDWLNEVNNEFFDIVKIPITFAATTNGEPIVVPANVREKNIRKVLVDTEFYRSFNYENTSSAMNHYYLDENGSLVLSPPANDSNVLVVYDKIGTFNFTSNDLAKEPEAPAEYHWLYILGLCVRIAKTQNDVTLANNYENDYKNALLIAQQNYARTGV
jgi:hypothetical protein